MMTLQNRVAARVGLRLCPGGDILGCILVLNRLLFPHRYDKGKR